MSKSGISNLSLGVDLMYGDMEQLLGMEKRSSSGSRHMENSDRMAPFDPSKQRHPSTPSTPAKTKTNPNPASQ